MFNGRQVCLQATEDTKIDLSRTNVPNEFNKIVLKKKNNMVNSFYNYTQKSFQERKMG